MGTHQRVAVVGDAVVVVAAAEPRCGAAEQRVLQPLGEEAVDRLYHRSEGRTVDVVGRCVVVDRESAGCEGQTQKIGVGCICLRPTVCYIGWNMAIGIVAIVRGESSVVEISVAVSARAAPFASDCVDWRGAEYPPAYPLD